MSVVNQSPSSDPNAVFNLIPTGESFAINLDCTDESAISSSLSAMMSATPLNSELLPENFVDFNGNAADDYSKATGYQFEITDITHDSGVYEYSTEDDEVIITLPIIEGLRDPVIVSGKYTYASFPLIHYSTATYNPPNFPARNDVGSVAITLPDTVNWPPYNDPNAPKMTYFAIDSRHDKDVVYTCTYTLRDHYNNSNSTINISYSVIIHNNTGDALGVDLTTFFSSL